ncbi:acetyl-CoA carboxylase biotin carboxyl carrier protein [Saccharopolyspora sp. ASAGF58]|uniref:acetyl-CoA carboxylase biotin carboxyl carrier protein n=1 Tax=Saccharopolyspora sp. ASAGF58 TaxID=2719023 RepID=UPI0014400391|nr:acetyl-CoA carboxylase biotin carboxyl carrier protein [Saccharopolyspora sp. ASAGF58]QIZ37730.1 acetyl-CoA carboxylase biotin carboxyl carrier protein [Saccharopolyspora sp. ASAGF58]
MTLTPADIKLIVAALQDSEWDQAEVVVGDVRVAVARNGAPLDSASAPNPAPVTAPAPAAAAPAPPESGPAASTAPVPQAPEPAGQGGGHVVTAPSVGVFWRAPEPGARPFVEVGSKVSAGDTIGIVEVMKLMSNVATDVAGTVTAVHVENAQGVEFGTPLVTIQPEN